MDIATNAMTSGYSGTTGSHIIYCSYTDQFVEIQVYSDSAIQVKNSGSFPMKGVITFIW